MCVRLPTQLCQAFPHHPISNLSLSCSRWRPFCVQEHLEYTKNTSKTTPHFPQILFCFVKLQFLCHFFRFISIGKASNTPIFPSFLAFFQKEFNRLDNYGPKPRPFCIWGLPSSKVILICSPPVCKTPCLEHLVPFTSK